jgi:hypothetical protein
MRHPELEFFNSLSARLVIELTDDPQRIGKLDSVRATQAAEIKSLVLTANVFDRNSKEWRALTAEELKSIAFRGTKIVLRGEGNVSVAHECQNGEFFTVQELLAAVAETERQSRQMSECTEESTCITCSSKRFTGCRTVFG